MVKIWSVKDFACIGTFEGHQSSVIRVVFLSRGMQLASAGSDGLVKVWNLKSSENVTTIDAHESKVSGRVCVLLCCLLCEGVFVITDSRFLQIWALSASADESLLATGSTDATLAFFADVTRTVQAEKVEAEERLIVQQQELDNLLFQKQYVQAARLALSLGHPRRLLGVLETIFVMDDREVGLRWPVYGFVRS
jgi:U3 small nucleolar RNA-associated protein 13